MVAKELEDMESTASCPQLSFSQVAFQTEAFLPTCSPFLFIVQKVAK